MNASMVGSKYNMSTISRGRVGETITDTVAPAFLGIADTIGTAVKKGDPFPIAKYAPPFGDFAYHWFGGGAEKILEREAKEERKKNRRKSLY